MALIYQQLMTPTWLASSAKPGSNVTFDNQGNTLVVNNTGAGVRKNLFTVKVHDAMRSESVTTEDGKTTPVLDYFKKKQALTFAIEIAFDQHYGLGSAARGAPMHPVHVMLWDYRSGSTAIGFRIDGDVQNYAKKQGPYSGISAQISGDSFAGYTYFDPGPERVVASTMFPQVFRMLLKTGESAECWGSCSSAIDSGHIHAVSYGTAFNFQNQLVALALYSDELTSSDTYRVSYIDLSIYKED